MNTTTHNGKEYMMVEDTNGVITLTPKKKEEDTRVCNLWQNKLTGELSYGVTSNTLEEAQRYWPVGQGSATVLIAHVRYNAQGKLPKLKPFSEQF